MVTKHKSVACLSCVGWRYNADGELDHEGRTGFVVGDEKAVESSLPGPGEVEC